MLGAGELVARHERIFARHVGLTALELKRALERQREEPGRELVVEPRPLVRYDAVIPA